MIERRFDALLRSQDFRGLVFLGGLALVAMVFAFAIRGILGPFLLASALALLLNPFVNLAEQRRVPRALAVLALYAIIGAIFGAGIFYLWPMLRQEFMALVAQGPAIAGYFQDLAEKRNVVSVLGVPIDLRQTYGDLVRNLPTIVAGQVHSLLRNVFMLVNWVFQALLMLLVAFFLVKDAHSIRRFFEDLVPLRYRDDAGQLAREIYHMLGAYMRGQLLICTLIGVATAVSMWVVGVPYSLALGIIAGVTAFIPFIGPFIGVLPAIAVAAFLSQSMGKVVVVLVVYFVISNIIYNFLSPKIFGDAVHLSPVLIILAFVTGGYLGGILGLFIAVPVAATLRILFLYLYDRVYS